VQKCAILLFPGKTTLQLKLLLFCYESFFDKPGQMSFIWFINKQKQQYGSVLFPPLKKISY